MGIRRHHLILVLIAAISVQLIDSCGTGGVALEFRATLSSHRLQVNSVGQDLWFLAIHSSGYQASRVPNVAFTVVSKSDTNAILRADDGVTLSFTVVTDTADLYLVKVTWGNLKTELWDCKELSKIPKALWSC